MALNSVATKFHKNAIFTGYIDCYCLVCESHLRSEEDVAIHIAKPIHSKNLDSTTYLEKFKDDCIRKIKKGYFCEFCNLLLSTAAKVGLHIAEPKHINNRGTQLFKRVGNKIIAFDDIIICEKAWNGLLDDTCAICNTEFENELLHKTEATHILNLVQFEVEFGAEKSIYRKIDESSFQCLTCNMVLAMISITTHFDQQEHKALLSKSRLTDSDINITAEKEPKNTTDVKEEAQPKDAKSKPVETKKPAEAKKPEKPHANLKTVTQDLDEEICKALGAKDYISEDENGKKWCLLCDWTMDCIAIDTHVNGRHHLTMLKLHKERIQKKLKSVKSVTEPKETIKEELKLVTDPKETIKEKVKVEPVETKKDVIETKTERIVKEPEVNPEEQENKAKILDSVIEFQKNDVNINFESGMAVCKKCSKDINFKFESIEAHIKEHKKKAPKKETVKPFAIKPDETKKNTLFSSPVTMKRKDSEESRASSSASREMDEDAEKYAKANDLIVSRADNKVYCKICDTKVPSSLKNMKEHIAGLSHKNRAVKVSEFRQSMKPATVKIRMCDFIKNCTTVENLFMIDIVLNEKYCMNVLSFFMITKQNGRLRCQACEVNINDGQADEHKSRKRHEKAMSETTVLTSFESEFIREVRPGIYHCGFCNHIEPSLEDLDNHLKSTSHREGKTSANWRLQQYMPKIALNHAQKQMEMMFLMRMLMNGNPFL